ncbi:toll/interleukin-1 receptor domain-containing protein [Aliarcobacter cryaerophilus]|uniref:TIR domain-containing protein n=1 Tax=Aliarcobacter cryaerophilus TaxID=28198 RepID=UPI003DA1CE89
MKIFFSYGRDNYKTFIQKIKNDLISKYNLNIWIDSDELKIADPNGWEQSIENGIENCDKVIYFLTPYSTRRPDGYCEKEIRYSIIFKKPIIPIMVEKSIPPISICTVQYFDIHNLANNFDIKTECFLNKNIEEQYYEKLEKIHDIIKNGITQEISKNDIQLLEYLEPLDFTYDISKHIKNFVGREWLCKKVDDLLKSNQDRVLWITAEAGFGKTAFSTYLQHQYESAIGIFYCRYDSTKRKDPLNILKTFIYQISTQVPEYKDILHEKKFKQKLEDLKNFKYHINDVLDEFLIQPLNKLNCNKNYFFIIDALDEILTCEPNLFVNLIPKFNDLPSWLKIIVTSRPEPYLKQKLSSLQTIEFNASLEQNKNDLVLYIQYYENKKNCEILKDKNIVCKLIEKSEGNILYLKEVIYSIIKGNINKTDIMNLPFTMIGLYLNMFERYFPDIDIYEEKIMPVFEILCAANQSLSKEFISDILNINKREFKKIINSMGSLIEENEKGEIYFYHKSLADWLICKDLSSSDYFVDIEKSQILIANFLWNKFKEVDFDFFNDKEYSNEIKQLLPNLIDLVDENISINILIDKYIDKLKENVSTQRDILYSFSYMKRDGIILAKHIIKWALSKSKDFEINLINRTRLEKAHIYGLLKSINKNISILEELKVTSYSENFTEYQKIYTNMLFEFGEYFYNNSSSIKILNIVEELFFIAYSDGRIDDIHGSIAILITFLKLEYGNRIDKVKNITDSISNKIIKLGDWGNWADEIKTIPDYIQEKFK